MASLTLQNMDGEIQEKVAQALKILGDSNRIKIIEILREGELCQCEVIPHIGQSQPTVSRHLNLLERHGVLVRRKEGTKTFYKIADEKVLEIVDLVRSLIIGRTRAQEKK